MDPTSETFRFEREYQGRRYACTRCVSRGRIYATQHIEVDGVGGKDDDARYGPGGRSVASMEVVASIIAREVIEADLLRRGLPVNPLPPADA